MPALGPRQGAARFQALADAELVADLAQQRQTFGKKAPGRGVIALLARDAAEVLQRPGHTPSVPQPLPDLQRLVVEQAGPVQLAARARHVAEVAQRAGHALLVP